MVSICTLTPLSSPHSIPNAHPRRTHRFSVEEHHKNSIMMRIIPIAFWELILVCIARGKDKETTKIPTKVDV